MSLEKTKSMIDSWLVVNTEINQEYIDYKEKKNGRMYYIFSQVNQEPLDQIEKFLKKKGYSTSRNKYDIRVHKIKDINRLKLRLTKS